MSTAWAPRACVLRTGREPLHAGMAAHPLAGPPPHAGVQAPPAGDATRGQVQHSAPHMASGAVESAGQPALKLPGLGQSRGSTGILLPSRDSAGLPTPP